MDKRYSEVTRMGTYNCDQKKIAKLSGFLQVTQEQGGSRLPFRDRPLEDFRQKARL